VSDALRPASLPKYYHFTYTPVKIHKTILMRQKVGKRHEGKKKELEGLEKMNLPVSLVDRVVVKLEVNSGYVNVRVTHKLL
jgi:hypothetical protein